MTESPDELSRKSETAAGAPEASPWTPPQQLIADGYRSLFPYPPAPYPGGYPPPQPYFGFAPPPPLPRNDLGIGSLVLGIIALLLSWLPFGGLILGICAVATGVAARKRVKRGEADNNRVTVAGIVLGTVAIIIGGVISMLMLYLLISYEECIAHAHSRYEYGQC
jgi:hypothetical protein